MRRLSFLASLHHVGALASTTTCCSTSLHPQRKLHTSTDAEGSLDGEDTANDRHGNRSASPSSPPLSVVRLHSIAECHVHCSTEWWKRVRALTYRSSSSGLAAAAALDGDAVESISLHRTFPDELLHEAQDWYRQVASLTLLPRQLHRIHDILYLCEAFGIRSPVPADAAPSGSDGDVLQSLQGWADAAISSGDSDSISFPTLLQLLSTFRRYRHGVRWGGSGGSGRRSHHHPSYLLHPLPHLYCPDGAAQQLPYVKVLQWMMKRQRGGAASEGFLEPFITPSSSGFTALDLHAQSGFGTDFLFTAGAAHVTACDADPVALLCTQQVVQERHPGSLTSSSPSFCVCTYPPEVTSSASCTTGARGDDGETLRSDTFALAAAQRRRQSTSWRPRQQQQHHSITATSSAAPAATLPVDVVFFHPPADFSYPFPFQPLALAALSADWKANFLAPAARGSPAYPPLTWLPVATTTTAAVSFSSQELHATLQSLSRWVKPSGYVLAVLPRLRRATAPIPTLEADGVLGYEREDHSPAAEMVAALPPASWRLLYRQESAVETSSSSSSRLWSALLSYLPRESSERQRWLQSPPRALRPVSRSRGGRDPSAQGLDVLVFRRQEPSFSVPSRAPAAAVELDWQETLQYDEYQHQSFPSQHHWLDVISQYGYLAPQQQPDAADADDVAIGLPTGEPPAGQVLSHGPTGVVGVSPRDPEDTSLNRSTAAAATISFYRTLKEKRATRKFQRAALSDHREDEERYVNRVVSSSSSSATAPSSGLPVDMLNLLGDVTRKRE